MRVLYFTRDYTTHDRRFVMALGARGVDVRFLRLEDDGQGYETRELPAGVSPVQWAGGRGRAEHPADWLALVPDLQRVLDEIRPDLVHAGPVQSCGFMAALLECQPLVTMSWASDLLVDADRDPLWRWLTSYSLARSHGLVCDSETVRAKAIALVPHQDSSVTMLPWGLDLRELEGRTTAERSTLRRDLGWEGCRVVLCTRSWEPVYGIDVVLEAFRRALLQDPALRLVLLGSGSERERHLEFLSDNDLGASVQVPGRIPQAQTARYFESADVYLSAAHSDGTSVSLLEAMWYGLAPVVTDHPSNREWIVPGENGWLARDGAAEEFASMLLAATRQTAAERELFAERNRAIIARRANWEQNVERLVAMYGELCSRIPPRWSSPALQEAPLH